MGYWNTLGWGEIMPSIIEKIDLGNIGKIATDIRTALTGKISPDKQMELEVKLLEMENQAMNAQIELNKIEATSPNLFVSGWRPFIGWVCGAAFTFIFVLAPILSYFKIPAPEFDTQTLTTLLFALLGLGGMRSWEKKNGVQGKH
jgi:hypothetical protein